MPKENPKENRKGPVPPDKSPFKKPDQINRLQDTRFALARKPVFARFDDAITWFLRTGAALVNAPGLLALSEVALPVCWSVIPGGAE